MRIELVHDTTVEDATQSDIDYVSERFRAGDRMEADIFGAENDRIDMFEQCWKIGIRGKTVGYCGVAIAPGETILSRRRYLCFMSCEDANRFKITFVRMSRNVMREIVLRTHEWVETFMSAPVEEYRGSVIWHERVLKMHRVGTCEFEGHRIVNFEISRKEVLS